LAGIRVGAADALRNRFPASPQVAGCALLSVCLPSAFSSASAAPFTP
jgi:hypothetical protein